MSVNDKVEVFVDSLNLLNQELEDYRVALTLIAAPKRPDGTYNRCREACEKLAREVLDKYEVGN